MASKDSAQIFVVGRDGNGKSSTIATIVGDNSESLQDSGEIEVKFSPKNNVRLADGKGVGEPLEYLVENDIEIEKIINNVDHVMNNVFDNLLTAIVFVMRYGFRFTLQDKKSLQIIKAIFGQDVIRQHGVVVITYGDNYDEENMGTFQEWCLKQEGDFKSLMEECNYRCLLFKNKDVSKRESQVKEFMKVVSQIDETIPYIYTPHSGSRKKLIEAYKKLVDPRKPEESRTIVQKMVNLRSYFPLDLLRRSLVCFPGTSENNQERRRAWNE